jgi:prepilin-type processing-associated H-X9-DG protein
MIHERKAGWWIAGVAFLMGIFLPALTKTRRISHRMECGTNIYALGKAFHIYAADNNYQYPTKDRWCDLVLEHTHISEEQLNCPLDKDSRCSYAINPYCEPNSPNDVVLLFDAKGDWNTYGGVDIINPENHKGVGINVLFNDGHAEFVRKEEGGELNWGEKEDE